MKNTIRRIKNTMPTIKNTIRQFSASVNMGLKKLLTLRTLIKILITFIFTICIRVWLKKYDITFIESDILFNISSIITISGSTFIKYFFESLSFNYLDISINVKFLKEYLTELKIFISNYNFDKEKMTIGGDIKSKNYFCRNGDGDGDNDS
jgi:hypothetical protein